MNERTTAPTPTLTVRDAAVRESADVLTTLSSTPAGLTSAEAATRRDALGPNVLREHRARPWRVLARQLKSPILILLFVTAVVSMFLGETANAVIIGIILAASIGLGFVNEYGRSAPPTPFTTGSDTPSSSTGTTTPKRSMSPISSPETSCS